MRHNLWQIDHLISYYSIQKPLSFELGVSLGIFCHFLSILESSFRNLGLDWYFFTHNLSSGSRCKAEIDLSQFAISFKLDFVVLRYFNSI